MDKKKIKNIDTKILVCLFVLAAVLILIGLGIYFLIGKHCPNYQQPFISLYAAICGGLMTLLGVLMNIAFISGENSRLEKQKFKPEFYMPAKFNLADVEQIYFEFDCTKKLIPNNFFYFRNSNKIAFFINRIIVGDKNLNTPENQSFYVESSKLFSIAFYADAKVESIEIVISDLNDIEYVFIANCSSKCVSAKKGE